MREILDDKGNKRKNCVPVIPRVSKKKIVGESSTSSEHTNQAIVIVVIEVVDVAQHTEVTVFDVNQVGTSSDLVDLTDKSPREKKKEKHRLVDGPTESTKEGYNQFPAVEVVIIFRSVIEDGDKRRVLYTYRGLHSKIVLNCLVSNILLPANVKRWMA